MRAHFVSNLKQIDRGQKNYKDTQLKAFQTAFACNKNKSKAMWMYSKTNLQSSTGHKYLGYLLSIPYCPTENHQIPPNKNDKMDKNCVVKLQ